MEKVKVKKDVFDALEHLRKRTEGYNFKSELNYRVINGSLTEEEEILKTGVTLVKLIDIAYCGYELELSPEEKILKEFNDTLNNVSKKEEDYAFLDGMRFVLNSYDIKIKGVNC